LIARGFLGQLVVSTIEPKLQSIGDAKLLIDLTEIVLDYLLSSAELIGNLLIALALHRSKYTKTPA
jgi:hypothetical protein